MTIPPGDHLKKNRFGVNTTEMIGFFIFVGGPVVAGITILIGILIGW